MIKTANQAWIDSIREVLSHGSDVTPRDVGTKEIMDQQIIFDMNYPICHHPDRRLSYQFMAAEAYWITSGSSLVEEITPYNKHIANYTDDGVIFNGAYGPMFSSQLEFVVNTLSKDPYSRQAVMTIWHPNPEKTKDHKCTIALVFTIRDFKLRCKVLMRSNDLFLGRPYDMFNFTMMALKVLTRLNTDNDWNIGLGEMCLNVSSSHIYDTNKDACMSMLNNISAYYNNTNPVPLPAMKDWQYVVDSLIACRDKTGVLGLWRIRP